VYQIIDIETENTGSDIMRDNKRIISVQIGDDTKQELYYADSEDPRFTLAMAKERIESLLSQGVVFAGYNIKGFDIPLLKQFLGVEIPESSLLELSQTTMVTSLCQQRSRNRLRLEEICILLGIDSSHKKEMKRKAETYKTRPEIIAQAQEAARDIASRKGWSLDFSYGYAIDKIAGGNAIFDSYKDFVASKGSINTLFYRYAAGDVISEFRLLKHIMK